VTCSTTDCERPRYGLMDICHPCYRRAYYLANRERMNAQARAYAAANADQISEQKAARYAANREAVAVTARAYRLANPEKGRTMARRYYAANRDRLIAKAILANRERSNELLSASVARWRKAHPAEYREMCRRRRASKLGAYVTKADYAGVLAEFGMVCHLCDGDIASMADLDFDHVIPLSKGGAHSTENIRPSHRHCNRSKGAKLTA
jgi:5-methylcytosine-specific restriction endonuclease McrA